MDLKIEPDYKDAFDTWKADPSPAGNATFLKALDTDIDKAIRTHVGEPNPLTRSRAKLMALDGMKKYDPTRSRIRTHLHTQLQGLKRYNAKQRQILKVPERIMLDRRNMDSMRQELEDELGREPTDDELARRTGFSRRRLKRIRSYEPGANTGLLSAVSENGFDPAVQSDSDVWLQTIYDDLSPMDQKVFEWTLGWNGHRSLSNQEIARKLGRSPGAISQRKLQIQKLIDAEADVSAY